MLYRLGMHAGLRSAPLVILAMDPCWFCGCAIVQDAHDGPAADNDVLGQTSPVFICDICYCCLVVRLGLALDDLPNYSLLRPVGPQFVCNLVRMGKLAQDLSTSKSNAWQSPAFVEYRCATCRRVFHRRSQPCHFSAFSVVRAFAKHHCDP